MTQYHRYEYWLVPQEPLIGGEQTQLALRLLPNYYPPPVPTHRIEWNRHRHINPGAAMVAKAWMEVVDGIGMRDNPFTDRYLFDELSKR